MEIPTLTTHEQALKFRARRNELLASNIANVDTPNYKARDINFASALRGIQSAAFSVSRTSELHLSAPANSGFGTNVMYRVPMQPSLDGNSVEADVEQTAFAENAVQYRASLAFVDSQIRTLRLALKGSD